jgi:hypothetical protein
VEVVSIALQIEMKYLLVPFGSRIPLVYGVEENSWRREVLEKECI